MKISELIEDGRNVEGSESDECGKSVKCGVDSAKVVGFVLWTASSLTKVIFNFSRE